MAEDIKNLRELYATELEPKLIELDGERRLIIKLIKRYVLISILPLFAIGFISYTYQTNGDVDTPQTSLFNCACQ